MFARSRTLSWRYLVEDGGWEQGAIGGQTVTSCVDRTVAPCDQPQRRSRRPGREGLVVAQEAGTLGEPYSRYIGDKTRELCIPLYPDDVRVTDWPRWSGPNGYGRYVRRPMAMLKVFLSERYNDE